MTDDSDSSDDDLLDLLPSCAKPTGDVVDGKRSRTTTKRFIDETADDDADDEFDLDKIAARSTRDNNSKGPELGLVYRIRQYDSPATLTSHLALKLGRLLLYSMCTSQNCRNSATQPRARRLTPF